MIKRKRKILILGSIIIALTAVLGIYLFLASTGVIHASVNDLIIKSADITKDYDGKALTNDDRDYLIVSGNLHEGHKIIPKYYSQISAVGQTSNEMTIEIVDANGEDVSKEYNLTVNFGFLTINKRSITIVTASASKPYDGTPLSKDEYQITKGSIVLGEEETIICTSQITEIGEIENECNVSIINSKTQADVTNNYDVEIEYGTLEVGRRELIVKSEVAPKEYDGEEFVSNDTDFMLVGGEFINPTHHIEYVPQVDDIKDAGEYTYKFSCIIKDEEGRDVSSSYQIDYDYGNISITRRKLEVKLIDRTKYYDTLPIYQDDNQELVANVDYTVGNLVGEDILTLRSNLEKDALLNTKSVGIYPINAIYELKTNNEDNYEITVLAGKYTVSKALITVSSKNDSKLYDGKLYYEYPSWELSSSEYEITGNIYDSTVRVFNDMTEAELEKTKEVGNHPLKIKAEIYENEKLSSNFDIKYEPGELKVSKYRLTISVGNIIKTYDHKPLYDEDNKLLDSSDYKIAQDLLEGTRIEVRSKLQGSSLAGTINSTSGEGIALDVDATLLDAEGNDVTKNYEIDVIKGRLVVNKRNIFINLKNPDSKTYDGQAYSKYSSDKLLSVNDYEISSLSPLIDHASVALYGALSKNEVEETKNAGSYTLKASATLYYDKEDDTSNYNVVITQAQLIVLKKPIVISAKSCAKVYDGDVYNKFLSGNILSEKDDYLLSDKLVGQDEIEVLGDLSETEVNKIKKVGQYYLRLKVNSASDILKNYDFSCVDGSITITKKLVTIKTKNVSKEYDGTPYYDEKIASTDYEYSIVASDDVSLNLISKSGDIIPGTYKNAAEFVAYGKDYENYEFEIHAGVIEIKKVGVAIALKEEKLSYKDSAALENGSLIDSNWYSVSSNKKVVVNLAYTGATINKLGKYLLNDTNLEAIISLNNEEITKYCDILIASNNLLVTKEAMLTVKGVSKTYDGASYINLGDELMPRDYEFDSLEENHQLKVTYSGDECKDPGQYLFKVSCQILDEGGNDLTELYDITYDLGYIVIRYAITVTFNNVAKEYDGKPFYEEGFEFDAGTYEVTAYDGLEYKLFYNGSTYKDAGTYDIKLALKVLNNDKDVTKLCDITIQNKTSLTPTMTITKRQIEVYTGSASKVDDGTPLSFKKLLVDGEFKDISEIDLKEVFKNELVLGDDLIPVYWSEISTPSTCANFVMLKVVDSEGNVVTKNYDIHVTTGLLEIYRLITDRDSIKISPAKQAQKYDANTNIKDALNSQGKVLGLSEFENAGFEVSYQIVLESTGQEPGKYVIKIDEDSFKLTLNGADVTSTYKKLIIFETDYLYWYLYDIKLTSENKESQEYNGSLDGGEVILSSGTLGEGHTIQTISHCVLNELGSILNKPKYMIKDSNGNDVTDLYNIEESFGQLTISAPKYIEIGITLNDDNNLILTSDEYKASLCEGDSISYIKNASGMSKYDLSNSDLEPEYFEIKIVNKDGLDVTSCYSISYYNIN